jgi:hypothetical protein
MIAVTFGLIAVVLFLGPWPAKGSAEQPPPKTQGRASDCAPASLTPVRDWRLVPLAAESEAQGDLFAALAAKRDAKVESSR